jgi:hypothetical protein
MSIIEIFCEGAVIGKHMAVAEISMPLFAEVAIPQVQKREVKRNVLSAQEKAGAQFRASGVSTQLNFTKAETESVVAAMVRGSEPFDGGTSEPDAERAPGFQPVFDGRGGPDRAQDVDRVASIDPAIKREGLEPARLDSDSREGDELADSMYHHMAVTHDDPDVPTRICRGEDCDEDHVARAAELLHKHMSLREALPGSNGRVKFQR